VSDITKCKGEHCKRREQCYRFTAPSNEYRQAYFTTAPVDVKHGTCEYYWPVRGWEPPRGDESAEVE
jgi:hypothetical protein